MKVPFSMPDIGKEESEAVQRVMDTGWVSQGPEVKSLEQELAKYIGCREVVITNNGTSALFTALLAHEVSEAILPSYSFPATLNAIRAARSRWIASSIDPKTGQMIPPHKDMPTRQFSAYIPVSFAGMPFKQSDWKGHVVIEDAAESLGAASEGIKTGAQGWTATFSFHTAKLITTIEGGAVATDDEDVAYEARIARNQGEDPKNKGHFIGYGLNCKMSDVHASIGRVQLMKIEQYLDNRESVAQFYKESLGNLVEYQVVPSHVTRHANMLFPVFVKEPLKISALLKEQNIETRTGWPSVRKSEDSEYMESHVLCLPMFNTMRLEEAEYVVTWLKKFL